MRSANYLERFLIITLCIGLFTHAARATEPEKPIRIDQENLAKLSPADQEHALEVACRLETIASIDRSTLTREERKALRMETRELKREVSALNELGGGPVIYISVGTVIIILLIILILT